MPESKIIGTISIITDCETGMYKMGEVDGGLNDVQLIKHVEKYGHEGLCEKLAYMQWQVWQALREVNAGRFKDHCNSFKQ